MSKPAEQGVVAGAEALMLGVLVLVVGTLVGVGAWGVIDARFATEAAAREAVRAAVTAPVGADLEAQARAAGRAAFAGHGRAPDEVIIAAEADPVQRRCGLITFRASTTVRPLPVAGFGQTAFEITARHTGVVDPYRSGLAAGVDCAW